MANESDQEMKEIEGIGRDRWESYDYSEGEFGLSDSEKSEIDRHSLVIDYMQKIARTPGIPIYMGHVFFVMPLNTDIVLNFTTTMGKCSGMYWSYIFQMPKWAYNVRKVDESMDVSPIHADTYNLFMGQRQKLEGQIKQGLASAMQAVTDYELLAHDSRRYREMIDYFKEGRKDEHVIRSLFVDRVDSYTGEGYSMITMAKRWPTIITDFIRMGQEKYVKKKWTADDVIRELDVTQAEATVLITKNRLFQEWKKLFMPTVAERYARVEAMVNARKKSVNEYKNWLKPYVARHKMMKEKTENPSAFATDAYMAPAFGTGYATTSVRLWVWKEFPVSEKRKPEARTEHNIDGIPWIIDPLDDFVREWARKIEYKYRFEPGTYDDKAIRAILKNSVVAYPQQAEGPVHPMVPSELYYVMFDIKIDRTIIKVPPPAGGEIEDLMIKPMNTWIASQNAILVHLIELNAKEKAFSREVDEMLGTKKIEDVYMEESRILLGKEPLKKKEKSSAARFVDGTNDRYRAVKKRLGKYSKYLFRPGPYESSFHERVVKMYMPEIGGFYGQQVDFWKKKAGVG